MINPPIVDLDVRRENAYLRRELELANKVIDDMLCAPYLGMTTWAHTTACTMRKHPEMRALLGEDHPGYIEPGRCFCRRPKEVPPQT